MLIAITKSGWLIGNKSHTYYTQSTNYTPNRVVLLSRDIYTNLANLFYSSTN
jgi:hypothetical protein